jgi:hypothetical protein
MTDPISHEHEARLEGDARGDAYAVRNPFCPRQLHDSYPQDAERALLLRALQRIDELEVRVRLLERGEP